MYFLKKTEQQVKNDVGWATQNITKWLEILTEPNKNPYNIKYKSCIANEQEFNTNMYGIKGKIDSTLIIED